MTRIALQPVPDRLANQRARSGAFDIGDLVGAVVICGALLFEEPSIFYFRLMVHIGILLFATGAEVVLALGQLDQVVGLGPVFQCTVGDVVSTGVGVAFIVNFILTLLQHYYNNTTSFLPSSTHTIVRAVLSPIKLAYYINLLTNQGEQVLKVCSGSLLPFMSNACSIFLATNLQFSVMSLTPETPLSKFFLVQNTQFMIPSTGAMIPTMHPQAQYLAPFTSCSTPFPKSPMDSEWQTGAQTVQQHPAQLRYPKAQAQHEAHSSQTLAKQQDTYEQHRQIKILFAIDILKIIFYFLLHK